MIKNENIFGETMKNEFFSHKHACKADVKLGIHWRQRQAKPWRSSLSSASVDGAMN